MTNLSDYHAEKGVQLLYENNFANAIDELDKAIEIDPSNAFGYLERGRAKEKLEDYQGAIDDYTKAIEIRDDDFYHENYTDTKQVLEEYHYQLSTVKKQLKDNKGADEDDKKADKLKNIL